MSQAGWLIERLDIFPVLPKIALASCPAVEGNFSHSLKPFITCKRFSSRINLYFSAILLPINSKVTLALQKYNKPTT
ncbi:hypothetical protein ILYODFUR_029541 [Ilyodon furcidens]|uniref:Uncharacterized protein n=1 Tax=Ilyodon furcidens TaxID=33524 RepID=A0ABV0TYR3_9TELE